MTSRRNARCHTLLAGLPADVQHTAVRRYQMWILDPFSPGFHFKEVLPGVWSVRVNQNYRALGRRYAGDVIVWFWIGPHAEYDRLIG